MCYNRGKFAHMKVLTIQLCLSHSAVFVEELSLLRHKYICTKNDSFQNKDMNLSS